MNQKTNSKCVKDFTLIELLVVVAVIAILASMLLTALNKAREKAKSISCINNLKQLGYGINMYANSFDGFAPPSFASKFTTSQDIISTSSMTPPPIGLGLLYSQSIITNAHIFWCPSSQIMKYDHPSYGMKTFGTYTTVSSYPYRGGVPRLTKISQNGACADEGFFYYGSRGQNHTKGYNVLFYAGHAVWHNDQDNSLRSLVDNTVDFYKAVEP